MTNHQRIYFNGLDGATGNYLLDDMSVEDFTSSVYDQRVPKPRAVKAGIAAEHLPSAGWAVVLPADVDPGVKQALLPLLELRGNQIGDERLCRKLTATPGQSALRFLSDYGAGPGPADPLRVPYNLLLIGGPEQIPFELQYDLGVQRAVGRLAFETPEEYANYVQGVLECENNGHQVRRRATLFGVQNEDDRLTRSSVENMVLPLTRGLEHKAGWDVETVSREQATKDKLSDLLGGAEKPALLLTAGHAVGFKCGHERQTTHQGGLVCSDWPGPKKWTRPIPERHYFAAHDVSERADLSGMITFFFACYSAGTPHLDSFSTSAQRREIAPRDFVAALPRRLLGRSPGNALAVIGHIDRAWQHSFLWPRTAAEPPSPTDSQPQDLAASERQSQTAVFESALSRLMDGAPVGSAMQYFGQRYAELSAHVTSLRTAQTPAPAGDFDRLRAHLWMAYQDARGYLIFGDPAVRLPLPPERGLTV